jgi:ubiquinone/menaquinone biosynthesis C-methylase UbiE
MQVKRVLDIGCGAGQEMLPFVVRGAKAIGIDTMLEAGQIGREMFKAKGFGQKVDFIHARGQELPFANDTFDVLICRIALMYMPIKLALSEIERVCRKGGILFLKYHAPSYYWSKFREGLKSRNILSSVHALRCIQTGYFYKMTGRQSFNKLTANGETFITRKMLQYEFKLLSLKIIGEMPSSSRLLTAKERSTSYRWNKASL